MKTEKSPERTDDGAAVELAPEGASGPIGTEGTQGATGQSGWTHRRPARLQRLSGPFADIRDTARIMPAHMEAKWSRQEKLHPLVITNQINGSACETILENDPAVASAIRRDGAFVLIRQADKPRRASWYRVG